MPFSFSIPICVALLLALGLGCGDDVVGPADPAADRAAAFDRFWSDFDQTYPYFDDKQVDWSVRSALRDRAAQTRTDAELVAVLQEAIAPLKDAHAWFRRPDGTQQASYQPQRAPNWDQDTWSSYLARLAWQQGQTNWGRGRAGGTGYLAVGAWNRSQVDIADLDAALEHLRDTDALVLDVRMNGGGSDALALELAGRFTDEDVPFGAHRFRSGPGHSDLGPWTEHVLKPRGSWHYGKPVYLLVGPGCFSSNETFIAAMRELPHVTVAGDTTGGSSGNPTEFPLVVGERDTNWKYAVPRWIEVLLDGTVIEWNGIAPDVVVPYDTVSQNPPRDAVLEWAFREVGVEIGGGGSR
jgi:hypothetical protein